MNEILFLLIRAFAYSCALRNADGEAKFNVIPEVRLVESRGMKTKDLSLAEAVIEERKEKIIEKWKEFHGE